MKTIINIINGYGYSTPKITAKIDGVEYLIERDYLCELLENMIEEKGYTIAQTSKQKYPRLIINK